METATNTPKVITSKEGAKFDISGHEVTVILHNWAGNNNYVFRMSSPPGSGIIWHELRETNYLRASFHFKIL